MGDFIIGSHFLDTGPIFCLAGSKVIADLYDEHLLAGARVVEAVVNEVSHRAEDVSPPPDTMRRGPVNAAARHARWRYKALLDGAVPRPNPVPDALEDIETSMRTRELAKNKDKVIHPNAHRGECESIHAATSESAGFVTNDGDAGREAEARGIAPLTFVDLARYLRSNQYEVKAKKLLSELQGLANRNIDIGEPVQSVLDLNAQS